MQFALSKENSMEISSPAFEHHQPIPKKYTCQGENVSPKLLFAHVPEECKSLALVVDDPDAPMGTFDHWIVWNIPPSTKMVEEDVHGLTQGLNGFRQEKYNGPCPPHGKPHRYFFKVYALDVMLDLPAGSTKKQLEEAIKGHVLSKAELIGTYRT